MATPVTTYNGWAVLDNALDRSWPTNTSSNASGLPDIRDRGAVDTFIKNQIWQQQHPHHSWVQTLGSFAPLVALILMCTGVALVLYRQRDLIRAVQLLLKQKLHQVVQTPASHADTDVTSESPDGSLPSKAEHAKYMQHVRDTLDGKQSHPKYDPEYPDFDWDRFERFNPPEKQVS